MRHISAFPLGYANRVAVGTAGEICAVFGQKCMVTAVAMEKFGIAQVPVEFADTVDFSQPQHNNNRQPDYHIDKYQIFLVKFNHNSPPAASCSR